VKVNSTFQTAAEKLNAPLSSIGVEKLVPLGFPAVSIVESLYSIAHLFGATKPRCGIYCLVFSPGHFYIGQAIEVVRRFSQHRKNYDDIVGFTFLPVLKSELNDVEKKLIYEAENIGLTMRNVVHVTNVAGDTDLDLLLPLSEQESWLSSEYQDSKGMVNDAPRISLPESHLVRFATKFDQYNKHPLHQKTTAILGSYLSRCIPSPRLTEYSFWSVSCMPSTNKNTWPRLYCVNAASMELFVVGWDKHDNSLWAFLTVDEDVLIEHWPDPEKFTEQFRFVEYFGADYRDAGQNQITLRCTGAENLSLLLQDVGVCKAAASLNLRVMRKRSNFYMQYHCPQLSNLALDSTRGRG